MEQFEVTGMTCAACQARVEKAVSKVPGVTSCAVSLLTNSMGVEGSASSQSIIAAVEKAGYGASPVQKKSSEKTDSAKLLEDKNSPLLVKRLISSLVFLLALMYVSMGHMMWGFPLPSFFNDNHVAMALVQLLLCVIVLVINQKFFVSGFRALLHLSPNMDTLVALGSGVSFAYSCVNVFLMTDAQVKGGSSLAAEYMDRLYFEGAAMIVTLITVGKLLESLSKGRTTNALKSLMSLAPKTACLLRDGKEVLVPLEEVCAGDIFIVRPGETVPVDGIVLEGSSAVNESALTGESIPQDKQEGSSVSGATLNVSGMLKCRALRVGEDTTLSQIIKMVSDAATTKAPIAKIADTVSGFFVPAVMGIALVTAVIWLITGSGIGFALSRAIAVLVVSCPCALGLATPVAIMVGNGVGAKNGILFKTATALEQTGKASIVALDKTGTVTKGSPSVTDVISCEGVPESELLQYALDVEKNSEHPLAKAVVEYALSKNLAPRPVTDFAALVGSGVYANVGGSSVKGGSIHFMQEQEKILFADDMLKKVEELSEQGKTPLAFCKDGTLLGVIAVCDTIKEDSVRAIKEMQNMGLSVVLLTGDNQRTASAVAKQAGVDSVVAEVLPDGKEKVVCDLMKKGFVIMVGDGINDAPALTRANVGIAIGSGTDVALDAADIVLMNSRLTDVSASIRLSRSTLRNIKQNLFWAFFYNVILIPIAAGLWYNAFGITINPMLCALAMSLSSFFVVTNALRLNLVDIYNSRHDKKIIKEKTMSEENVTKTYKVEGMMCGHCESHVKEAIEKIKGVSEAVASHEKGQVTVTTFKPVKDSDIAKAIEKAGYKFLG